MKSTRHHKYNGCFHIKQGAVKLLMTSMEHRKLKLQVLLRRLKSLHLKYKGGVFDRDHEFEKNRYIQQKAKRKNNGKYY